jgi:hypothetical protein
MEIRTIGIDLGKTVFHLVAIDARGKVVARKKCSRTQQRPAGVDQPRYFFSAQNAG